MLDFKCCSRCWIPGKVQGKFAPRNMFRSIYGNELVICSWAFYDVRYISVFSHEGTPTIICWLKTTNNIVGLKWFTSTSHTSSILRVDSKWNICRLQIRVLDMVPLRWIWPASIPWRATSTALELSCWSFWQEGSHLTGMPTITSCLHCFNQLSMEHSTTQVSCNLTWLCFITSSQL